MGVEMLGVCILRIHVSTDAVLNFAEALALDGMEDVWVTLVVVSNEQDRI